MSKATQTKPEPSCLLCGRKAKYICDGGCVENQVAYCGYCSRKKIVIWIGKAMKQRLCAVCALREEKNPRREGIYDAQFYTVKEIQNWLNGKSDALTPTAG